MPKTVRDRQTNFLGGFTQNSAELQQPGQWGALPFFPGDVVSQWQNMRLGLTGRMEKRPGFFDLSQVGLGISTMMGGVQWRKGDGTATVMSVFQNGAACHLYTSTYQVTLSGNPHLMVYTDQGSGLSLTIYPTFTPFINGSGNECMYIADGGTKLSSWDGTTFSVHGVGGAGVVAGIKAIWTYNQRLYGCTGADQTLYWSALNNGDTLGDTGNGGGAAIIRTYGGRSLTCGFALGATNMLMHNGAMSKFQGTTIDDIDILAGTSGHTPEIGILGRRSFIVIDNTAYVWTPRGLYLVTETDVQPYENPMLSDPLLIEIQLLGSAVPSDTGAFTVAHDQGTKTIHFVNPATKNIYGYSYRFGRMTSAISGAAAAHMDVLYGGFDAIDQNGQPSMLVGNSQGHVFAYDWPQCVVNPFAAPFGDQVGNSLFGYQARVTSGQLSFVSMYPPDPYMKKSMRRAGVRIGATPAGTPPVLTVDEVTDGTPIGSAVTTTPTLPSYATENVNDVNVPLAGNGHTVTLRISDASDQVYWDVRTVRIEALDHGYDAT